MKRVLKNIAKTDIIVIVLILVLQLLFCLDNLFSSKDLESSVLGFDYDLNTFLYVLATKLNLIILLLLWYFTCMHWWRISIAIPLTIEVFKLVSFLNPKVEAFDEIDFYTSVPITIPIVFLLIYITEKVNNYTKYRIIYNNVNDEIECVFIEISKENSNKEIEAKFTNLRNNKNLYKKSDYLNKLINLRDNIY
jgi:hypothetical protein